LFSLTKAVFQDIPRVICRTLKEQFNVNAEAVSVVVIDDTGRTTVYQSNDIAQWQAQSQDFLIATTYGAGIDKQNLMYHSTNNNASLPEPSRRSSTTSMSGLQPQPEKTVARIKRRPSVQFRNQWKRKRGSRSQSCADTSACPSPKTNHAEDVENDEDEEEDDDDVSANGNDGEEEVLVERTTAIRLDDEEGLANYYRECFTTIQQLAMKTLLKGWIKTIHPTRQTDFPYVRHESAPNASG